MLVDPSAKTVTVIGNVSLSVKPLSNAFSKSVFTKVSPLYSDILKDFPSASVSTFI